MIAPDDPRHGTYAGYTNGRCRCVECTWAKRVYNAELRSRGLEPGDPRHGSTAGYEAGCRCDECSAARRSYLTELRSRGLEPDDPRHGSVAGYSAGCRCGVCKAAQRLYNSRGLESDDPRHGSVAGYNAGCRCAECKTAMWAYAAIRHGKHRAAKFGGQLIDHTPEQFLARMSMFGNRCFICQGTYEHADHLKPLAVGGPNMLANWRPLCGDCNLRKGDMWPTVEPGERITDLVMQMVADIREYKAKTAKYARRRDREPVAA